MAALPSDQAQSIVPCRTAFVSSFPRSRTPITDARAPSGQLLGQCGVLNFVYFFAYVHLKRALAAREAKREAGAHGEAGATEAPVTPPPRRGGSGGDGAQEAPKVAGPSPMLRLVAGIAAGVVSQLVTNPINVTLTYIQTTDQKTRGFLPTLARIVRAEGPGALYRGLAVGCVLTLNPAIQYYVYDRLLEWAKARSKVKSGGQHDEAKATQGAMSTPNGSLAPLAAPASRALGVGPVFAISSTAKLVATLLTYPLILSKTRMQAEGVGAQRSMVGVLAKVFADEGLGGLYTGFNVQATKSILSAALMMVIKEAIDDVAKDLYESMRRGGVHGK